MIQMQYVCMFVSLLYNIYTYASTQFMFFPPQCTLIQPDIICLTDVMRYLKVHLSIHVITNPQHTLFLLLAIQITTLYPIPVCVIMVGHRPNSDQNMALAAHPTTCSDAMACRLITNDHV